MKIVQSVGVSLTDALTMSLTCTATCNCTVEKDNTTISNISQYDMKWSGMNLEHSLWIEQSHVIKEGDVIERKLFFKLWLGSHAGDYFCHFMKKDQSHVKTQKTVASGTLLVRTLYSNNYLAICSVCCTEYIATVYTV